MEDKAYERWTQNFHTFLFEKGEEEKFDGDKVKLVEDMQNALHVSFEEIFTKPDKKSAAISEKKLGEASSGLKPETTGMEGPEHASVIGGEPPCLTDTPTKFVERGPISFPGDVKSLTESTFIVVYLSLSATAEILSIDAIAKGVDELKVEVIKMILKLEFTPAYVGKMPVPCVAKCVVSIICKPVDQ